MTIPFNLPHLGATGVIQNLGDLGAIAGALQGLPQVLMAAEQQRRAQESQLLNQRYLEAQMAHLQAIEQAQQAKAAQETAQNQVTGHVLSGIAPQPLGQQVPLASVSAGPLAGSVAPDQTPFDLGSVRTPLAQVLQGVPGQFREEAAKAAKPFEEQFAKQEDEAKLAKLLQAYVKNPDALPSLFDKVPPALVGTFVEKVNTLKPEKGSWTIQATGPDRKLIAFNLEKGIARDLGFTGPPPSPGVTVNIPGEAERRAAGLGSIVDQALTNIGQLRAAGYDPLQESALAKVAGNVPMVGRTIQRASLSPSGRLYYDNVHEVILNGLYVMSGANSTPSELQNQANQLTQDFFDDPKTLAQKEQFLMARGEAIRTIAGRAAPGSNPLPKTWKEWAAFGKQEDAKTKQYEDEAKRLHP